MAGGYLDRLWEDDEPVDHPRYTPLSGAFLEGAPHSDPLNQQTANDTQQFPVQPVQYHPQHQQFVQPHQLFHQSPSLIPLSAVEDLHEHLPPISSSFQDPFNRAFASHQHQIHEGFLSQPVVHEGYIPAPGGEDEDDYPTLSAGYHDRLFQAQDLSSSSDESDFERQLAEEEELRELKERDNPEDADYSEEDEQYDDIVDPEDEVELEEPDDFEEKPTRGRGRGRGRGSRGGRRGRTPRGRGGHQGSERGRRKKGGAAGRPKGKRGPRAVADPGPEFRELQRNAQERFVAKDYEKALEYGQMAVQLNPEIFEAHSIVSEAYEAMGEEIKSIESLIIGAPTKRDPNLWHFIIERIRKLDTEDHPNYTEDVKTAIILQCLKSIIQLDSTNYEARSLKLEIEARLGHVSKSVSAGSKMLRMLKENKMDPDTEVLKIMAMMGTSTVKQTKLHLDKIITSFDESIEVFTGPHRDPETSVLDWELINIYLDLLDRKGDYEHAMLRLKTLSRWAQGRRNETYWDELNDDREFDIEDEPRRVQVFDFSRKSKHTKYGATLPLEIRVKMGLFRLRLGPEHYEEAMGHFEMLSPDDRGTNALVWDYLDLFRVIADALHTHGHDVQALRFYEPLLEARSEEMTLRSYFGLYTCYKNLNRPEKAEEIIPIFKDWQADTVDELAVLAKFFEVNGMRKEAMERGDACYRNRGNVKLRLIGFKGLVEIRRHYEDWRRRARGKYTMKKHSIMKQRRILRKATGADSDDEENGDTSLPSLGPTSERVADGLFQKKRSKNPKGPRAQTFLPYDADAEPEEPRERQPKNFQGTEVPMQAIDHRVFRQKLKILATDHEEALKTARAQHREIVASFERLDEIYELAEDGDQECIKTVFSIARELIEEFSTFDLFYVDKKEGFQGYFRRIGTGDLWKDSALMVLAVAANAVEDGETDPYLKEKPDEVPDDFWGVPFSKWCDAFGRYALLLAQQGDNERCFSTIEIALRSNIFSRCTEFHRQLELCRLVCALAVDSSIQASYAVRWFLKEYPFGSDLFRLYSSVNRLCSFPDGFATGPAHKVLMRYIKTMDFALLTPSQRVWYNFRDNIDKGAWFQNAINSQTVDAVKDHDPALFALYAHVLMCGGSYMAALNYYFRAFAVTPLDPVVNLCIGVAYIQHAMKRLSENRQFQIQQGLAFVYRYFELRTKDDVASHRQEAEFNVARMWHSLGLVTFALPAYERVIALSGRVKAEAEAQAQTEDGKKWGCEDFAREAAYAIQSIYVTSGNFEGARKVTKEVLVLE